MDFKTVVQRYKDRFTESRFWKFIERRSRSFGQGTIYTALLLFYAYKRKDTPGWAKRIVLGTLGYFLYPLDAVPDLSPLIGYTDDIGILSFGLVTIAAYVNQEVKDNARKHLQRWFKDTDEDAIQSVDKRL